MYAPAHASRLWHREEGSGPSLVLLHGLGDTHDLWRHQVHPLAERHRVTAMDLRGHGQSALGDSNFDLVEMSEDVRSTMATLGIERPVIVGLSMGGGVAQALAIRNPGLVRALVLVSTSSEFSAATRERFLTRATRAERDGMAAVIDETVPRWFTPEFMRRRPEEVERTRQAVLDINPRAFAGASRANAVRNLTGGLGTITCPVHFIGGAEDPANPLRALEIYRREVRALSWEIIPAASHLVPVEMPSTFNAILLRFLGEVELNESQGEQT